MATLGPKRFLIVSGLCLLLIIFIELNPNTKQEIRLMDPEGPDWGFKIVLFIHIFD